MTAQEIMTTELITVRPETEVRAIAQLMVRHRIGAVPVVGADGHLAGIVREADLVHRAETGTERHQSWWMALLADPEQLAHDYVKAHGTRAADVLSRDFVTVPPGTGLDVVARLLEQPRTRQVLVVEGGKPVGIISRADLVRALATSPPPAVAPPQDDDTIRQQVEQALRSAGWANAVCANVRLVSVASGVVELRGQVETDAAERAACIAAARVPGVRRVEDHLVRLSASVWAE